VRERLLMRARLLLRARHRFGARRGQAAVLIALSIFAMLLLLAMATNIGTVVNDKIRMQSTADLSTYAVAYSEAASMNELVGLNQEIVDAVHDCRQTLEAGPIMGDWPETVPCGCSPDSEIAEAAVQMCKMSIDAAILRFAQRAQYGATVSPALAAGRATADENYTGVTANFFDDVFGSPTHRGTFTIQYALNFGGFMVAPSVADLRQVSDTGLNYQVFVTCGEPPDCVPNPMLGRTTLVHSWFYKDTRDPDVWVAGRVSGTPEKQFLDTAYGNGHDGGYFGASSTGGDDLLVAYAVAKPYDGSIGPTELSGNQQNGNGRDGRGVYWARGTTYPELSMYDEYRARLAGVNENLEGTLTPSDLVAEDGWELGKSWDMSKFKH
jgi:hypothetical protein